jgi:hypothetical protein
VPEATGWVLALWYATLNTTKLNHHNSTPLCGLCAAGCMQYTGALQLGEKNPRVFPNPGGVFLGVFPGWVFPVYFTPFISAGVFSTRYFFYFFAQCGDLIGELYANSHAPPLLVILLVM